MAPSFLALRDRLPSLYRPDDDDLADERLPLAAADLVSVAVEPSGPVAPDDLEPRILSVGRGVSVQLPARTRLREATLAPGLAPSPAYALAVVLPGGLRPDSVAAVRENVAQFSPRVERPRFTLELRRLGVLSTYLLGIGELIDAADRDAALVMHAHWWAFADRARYSPFYLRRRALAGRPAPLAHDPDLVRFPYVHDLARLAASIPVVPWQEQSPRELVEAYRLRIRRIVELYRDGLGTLLALERMIEAELPVDLGGPLERRDRGMVLDEFAPLRTYAVDATAPGNLDGAVAPLMHWPVRSSGLAPSPATLFVEGIAASLPDGTAPPATVHPAVELYAAPLPTAIGYRDTVAPGETLRLRPAFSSWLGGVAGVGRSQSRPGDGTPGDPSNPAAPADPAAPGPWLPAAGIPAGTVVALKQTADRVLWAAIDGGPGSGGTLARCDGVAWTVALTGLARPHCLAEESGTLLVGTDDGISRVSLYPAGIDFVATPVAGVAGPVLALWVRPGNWLVGTPAGLLSREPGGAVDPLAIGAGAGTQIAVNAIAPGVMGSFLLGTERGVFEYQERPYHWYWYGGESASDQDPDWHRFDPLASTPAQPFPADGDVFLPPVRALLRGRDGTLWIGTEEGIARYVARAAERMAFTTALEAYPDVATGPVHAIAEDAHGVVWFGCEFGLVRADRRDIWHHDGSAWVQLGRLDSLYDGPEPQPRGSWRYDRTTQAWQRADALGAGIAYAGTERVAVPRPAVRAIAWTDDVVGDLGSPDPDGTFVSSAPVDPARLVLHVKPTDDRIAAGGIPAVPRIPPGDSTWRYLELERDDEPAPPGRPSWTREGRRIIGAPPPAGVDPPEPVRFDVTPPASAFDAGVLAFAPGARVRMQWSPTQLFSVAARLRRRTEDEAIDPAVLDRVWNGMSQVRPAGVRTALAVDETIMRGDDVGAVAG